MVALDDLVSDARDDAPQSLGVDDLGLLFQRHVASSTAWEQDEI